MALFGEQINNFGFDPIFGNKLSDDVKFALEKTGKLVVSARISPAKLQKLHVSGLADPGNSNEVASTTITAYHTDTSSTDAIVRSSIKNIVEVVSGVAAIANGLDQKIKVHLALYADGTKVSREDDSWCFDGEVQFYSIMPAIIEAVKSAGDRRGYVDYKSFGEKEYFASRLARGFFKEEGIQLGQKSSMFQLDLDFGDFLLLTQKEDGNLTFGDLGTNFAKAGFKKYFSDEASTKRFNTLVKHLRDMREFERFGYICEVVFDAISDTLVEEDIVNSSLYKKHVESKAHKQMPDMSELIEAYTAGDAFAEYFVRDIVAMLNLGLGKMEKDVLKFPIDYLLTSGKLAKAIHEKQGLWKIHGGANSSIKKVAMAPGRNSDFIVKLAEAKLKASLVAKENS